MKKIAIASFLIALLFCIPTFVVSEPRLLLRAVVKHNNYEDHTDYFLPRFLARLRLSAYGFGECNSPEFKGESFEWIHFLSAFHTEENDKALIRKYLSKLIDSGCSLEKLGSDGISPLQGAILFNDYDLIKFFVEKGASLDTKASRPGKKSHDKNALEFAVLLTEVEPDVDREKVISYLSER